MSKLTLVPCSRCGHTPKVSTCIECKCGWVVQKPRTVEAVERWNQWHTSELQTSNSEQP